MSTIGTLQASTRQACSVPSVLSGLDRIAHPRAATVNNPANTASSNWLSGTGGKIANPAASSASTASNPATNCLAGGAQFSE